MTLEERYFNLTGIRINTEEIKEQMQDLSEAQKADVIGSILYDIPGGIGDAAEKVAVSKAIYAELGPVSGDVTGDGIENEDDEEMIEILSSADIDLGSEE